MTVAHDDDDALHLMASNILVAVPFEVVVAAVYVDYCAVSCCAMMNDCATNAMKY